MMAIISSIFDVDLSNGPKTVQLPQMFTGNKAANRIGAKVYDHGEAVALGGSCTAQVILSDGSTISLTGTVSGNSLYVDLTEACYIKGKIEVYVNWKSGSTLLTTLVAGHGEVIETDTGISA